MFKKITIGKTRAARKVACVFTEDLDRKDHTGIPVGIRPDFVRGISNPGFQAETGETAFVDDLLLLGLGSEDSVDADTARKAGAMAKREDGWDPKATATRRRQRRHQSRAQDC